ncbi:MAG: DUF4350 domain-containing protein [Gemmatimonadaceae bacterium]
MAEPLALERWLSPRRVLIALGIFAVVAILLTPAVTAVQSGARLTTYATDPYGALGLYETLDRLGWDVERRLAPIDAPLDSNAIYAVLDPSVPLTAGETHELLDAVRRGASLIFVPGDGWIADSLDLEQTAFLARRIIDESFEDGESYEEDADQNGAKDDDLATVMQAVAGRPSPCGEGLFEQPRGTTIVMHTIGFRAPPRGDTTILVRTRPRYGKHGKVMEPAVLGLRLGAGRVVALGDPHLLRNDIIRLCDTKAGVRAVGLFVWLSARDGDDSAGSRSRIVFDEYHQGFGTHPSVARATAMALAGTPAGRALTALLLAGLILLAAVAPRPIAPRSRARIERRSPLEHVGALARAYEQVGASRTATRRLVAGLRRRHALGSTRAMDDADYLATIAERHPELREELEFTRSAMTATLPPARLLDVGRAIEHMERTMSES